MAIAELNLEEQVALRRIAGDFVPKSVAGMSATVETLRSLVSKQLIVHAGHDYEPTDSGQHIVDELRQAEGCPTCGHPDGWCGPSACPETNEAVEDWREEASS